MVALKKRLNLTAVTLLAALAVAGAFTALDVVPAASQDALLRAWKVEPADDLGDPWSAVWSRAKPSVITLSAQNATKPLGGGEVATLKARALQDGSRLYILLEWKDATKDVTVNGQTLFADSAAVEFPAVAGVSIPSFCMGDANGGVYIWHWKAAWQHDIDAKYESVRDRYPDGFVDDYPLKNDPVYQTARAAGNPLSQLVHRSPVENVVAGGFGTLTTADLQEVGGKGEWKDGRWRVVFVRQLGTSAGYPSFAAGDLTNAAFAVWDGGKGNRDGLKSVSQFMILQVSTAALPERSGSFPWWGWAAAGVILAAFGVGLFGTYYASRPKTA